MHIHALKGPILVMGASGFIGANLFKMIISHRNDVFAVVQHEKGWRLQDIDDKHVIAVDFTDSVASKNLINELMFQISND